MCGTLGHWTGGLGVSHTIPWDQTRLVHWDLSPLWGEERQQPNLSLLQQEVFRVHTPSERTNKLLQVNKR